MKKFNQGRSRNFNDRDSSRGFGGSRSGPSMMHKAVCSECGKDCEVPFRPSGAKPVFCSFCFEDKRGSEKRPDNRFQKSDSFKPRFDSNKKSFDDSKIDEVISRLDKIIKLLSPAINLKEEDLQLDEVKEKKASKKKKEASPKKIEKKKKPKTKTKAKK